VRFEPTNEVLPIVFYLLHALWDFVNKEVSSGKLKLTFVTSRIFLMNSDTAFIGFSRSEASETMLANESSKMAVSWARFRFGGTPPCVSSLGVSARGSSICLEGVSPCLSPLRCVSPLGGVSARVSSTGLGGAPPCVSPWGSVSCGVFPLGGVPAMGSSTGLE